MCSPRPAKVVSACRTSSAMNRPQTSFVPCCISTASHAPIPVCRISSTASASSSLHHTRRSLIRLTAICTAAIVLTEAPVQAVDTDDNRPQLKVSGGSASTSATKEKSVTKTVTRGVNLEGADFSGRSFEGVSFQQSILRQSDFSGCKLRDASFFDADLSGAKFVGADLRDVNFELANLRMADFTNANLTGAYISSTTKFQGAIIEGSDWSDTLLRKDQQKFLCDIASGTNPDTGIDTRESLFCLD